MWVERPSWISYKSRTVVTYNDKEYVVTVMSDGWSNASSEAGTIFDSVGSYVMVYLYNNKGE